MTNITKIIEDKAEKYGDANQRSTTGYYNTEQDLINAFTAGASFATTSPEVLKEILQPFAEWMHNNFKFDDGENKWFSKYDTGPFTLEQIIGFYIQHQETKQKEDEAGNNS